MIRALAHTVKLKHREKKKQEFLLAPQDVSAKVIKANWGLVSIKSTRKNVNVQVLPNQLVIYSI